MSPAMVSKTWARWPMLELAVIWVRSLRCPLPKRSAVCFKRSRSRQCGRSQISRQASNAAPISTLMLQYSRLTSIGSGGTISFTASSAFNGATAKVRQPQSPMRTTISPRCKRSRSWAVKPLSSIRATAICNGRNC
ncbi:hypothetical protein D3C78_1100710 [compost metagenome]